ncbi:unnamed protein product [Merluccius merluccius]
MGERFVVVPVGRGDVEGVVSDPAPETETQGAAAGGQRDPDAAVPILEYSREPNKYGFNVYVSVCCAMRVSQSEEMPCGCSLVYSSLFTNSRSGWLLWQQAASLLNHGCWFSWVM